MASPNGSNIYEPLKFHDMEKKNVPRRGRGGRPAKTDTATNCVMVRFTDEQYAQFLTMFEQSGVATKATFIKARVFGDTFRVIKTDEGTLKYVALLTKFHAQFRAVGTNYNQVVKELHIHFSQKKALVLLYKLERLTAELYAIGQRIVQLSAEFCRRW
jgi:predicted NAD/FAD-binding protein